MKNTIRSILLTMTLLLAAGPMALADNHKNHGAHFRGTTIFHWTVRKAFEPSDALANPDLRYGQVLLTHKQQGQSERQGLLLRASELEPNTLYRLWALIGDAEEYVEIQQFATDRRGRATLRFKKLSTRRGLKEPRPGHALAGSLDPVEHVREIAVATEDDVVVLRAVLTEPERFQYSVKRPLDNDGFDPDALGVLRLRGNPEIASISLRMSGLEPEAAYRLMLNGELNQDMVADENGNIEERFAMEFPVDILAIEQLEIQDIDENTILSTTLISP